MRNDSVGNGYSSDQSLTPPTPSDPRTPNRRQRVAVSAAFAATAAISIVARAPDWPGLAPDLDAQLCGARVWWEGGNPYAVTGPGLRCNWSFTQFYPATAFVALWPLTALPLLAARAVFAGLATFALSMALTRDGWHRLPLLVSAGFQAALVRVQWEPILVAAVAYPALAGLWAVKPNVGVVCAAGLRQWRGLVLAAAGAVVLLAVSLAWDPGWVQDWLAALRQGEHTVTLVPLGLLSALALPRWRDPAARLTAAFGLLPFTHLPYTSVLLFLAPRTWRQACLMSLATDVAVVISLIGGPYATFAGQTTFYTRFCAPVVLIAALWAVWARPSETDRPPVPLIVVTAAAGLFLVWLSFAVSQ